MRHVALVMSLCLVLVLVAAASADVTTLKGPGQSWDTKVSSNSTGETVFNYGGSPNHFNLYSSTRRMLVKFDLGAVPDVDKVVGVNSATLRLYQLSWVYSNSNKQVAQVAEDWVEGTAGPDDGNIWQRTCDGAQYYARNGGTVSTPQWDAGEGLYRVNSVADLAVDPLSASRWFVRYSPRNWEMQNRAYTKYDTLADLKTAGAGRNCYYDAANDVLWLQDIHGIRWFSDTDMFDTPGAATTGSPITDMTSPQPDPSGWLEFDVATVVENWLLNGQDNYGFKFIAPSGNQVNMATSEHATAAYHPELVLDLEVQALIPEPAGLSLVGLALLALRKRRS